MTQDTTTPVDGLVLYADGSFRRKAAGWGLHGYTYTKTPLTRGIGVKQLPTPQGYQAVELPKTVTPLTYFDGFGTVTVDPTNNTAELQAVIEAFKLAEELGVEVLTVYSDSEYVRKGLTQYMKKWVKNGWRKADGEPVANQGYWKQLKILEDAWRDAGKKHSINWIKGHSGDLGNELADLNALTGSGGDVEYYLHRSDVEGYHNPKVDANPLTLKTRMLFNLGGDNNNEEEAHYYYLYQLGRMQTYGHKQQDSTKDRHNKTDLLLGRRIADATFCVMRLDEPDTYLDRLQELHAKAHQKDVIELAVARLDNAYRPAIQQRIQQLRQHALIPVADNASLVTPRDDLVTKTLNPPRLAREAVDQFGILQSRLDAFLQGKKQAGVSAVEVTEHFFEVETPKGNKKPKTKLLKAITNTTPFVEIPAEIKGNEMTLKLVLGVDIPQRNPLAKLADHEPKVTVLLVANGPLCYSFATVFETSVGTAIYQSPYTQFVTPKQ